MTYDPTLATPKDRIRLLIGDTGGIEGKELLRDEEIEALLSMEGSTLLAAAAAAEAIAAKLAQRTDTSLPGGVRIAFGQRADHYLRLAQRLRDQAAEGSAPELVADGSGSAISRDPIFALGMHDVPGE